MKLRDKRLREDIDAVRRGNSNWLDLSGWRLRKPLTDIPDEVFDLPLLEHLVLRDNKIRTIPESVQTLRNLKRIDLRYNPLEQVTDTPGLILDWNSYFSLRDRLSPQNISGIDVSTEHELTQGYQLASELTSLPNLVQLDIGQSAIPVPGELEMPAPEVTRLIDVLEELKQLEQLQLIGIPLKKMPTGILKLKNLRHLLLATTGLLKVPDWLSDLPALSHLSLPRNELSELPDSLEALTELTHLALWENKFQLIPDVVFRLKKLTFLDLSCRYDESRGISEIPPRILDLVNLEHLIVTERLIEVPPAEVVKEGVEGIRNYWRQQKEVGIDYLCEAKLIILGEAGAGKTSLAKKILNRNYKLEPQEDSTEGIEVMRWNFPAAVRINRDGKEELLKRDFRVNIWDFGGQEVYHATHQFFLTRRSLYILVTDDRKEDTDFNYWLQVAELLSDRSPLLIVQNEKQDRQRDMDFASLRSRFPSLRDAFRTNLSTNRGLEEILEAIRRELERLPHIGTPLPKTWARVRTAMEKDTRNYIGLDEFLALCQQHGFKRREDKLQLSGYLHDLGICLHFQDDPVLKNNVILKPKWGTDAVYRVLDDGVVLNRKGRFGPQDLSRIWAEDKYSSMRDELLRLMMKFQLCYELPERQEYIAPQLLSPTRPAYDWSPDKNLILRYDYDFMPKGVITRFIVALNHLIADQSLVWKGGVILERDGTRAEITEDYLRRRVVVRVNGADPRSLLAIVDDQLDRIHSSFPRLKYEKFLPCNCVLCKERTEPFAYPLTELRDFARQGDKIQCRLSRKLVDAADLIREVLPSAVYIPELPPVSPDLTQKETRLTVESAPTKEVFVSYAWTENSTAIVDTLQETLAGRNIVFVRDKNDMRYKDSIREFMKRIGRGKCIVVILSRQYLESKSCMFEMTEIADRGDIRNRVFPIVLNDADIYDAIGRLRYIKHWEQKRDELDAEMKGVGGEYLQGIREELDLFAKIRTTVAQIVDILGDMNALTPGQHQSSNFDSLVRALESRLTE